MIYTVYFTMKSKKWKMDVSANNEIEAKLALIKEIKILKVEKQMFDKETRDFLDELLKPFQSINHVIQKKEKKPMPSLHQRKHRLYERQKDL